MSIYFILGQVGMALTVIMIMCTLHLQATSTTRPPWFYIIGLWLVAVAAAFQFGSPYMHQGGGVIPPRAYLFRFAVGLEHVGVFLHYRYRLGRPAGATPVLRLNFTLGVLSALFMIGALTYGTLYSKIEANGMAISKVGNDAKKAIILADSLRMKQLRADNDTLSKQLLALQLAAARREGQISGLQRTIDRLQKLIDVLVDQIRDLKKLIDGVGANVERSRRTVSGVAPAQRPPAPAINRDVTLPAPPSNRRPRRTGYVGGESDSTYYAQRQY